MKKNNRSLIFIIIVILFLYIWFNSENNIETEETIANVSDKTYTIMMYMCGSNLESDAGYASNDIEEILNSQLADEVNLLIYTGGSSRWFSYGISNKTNQIYKVENHELVLVKDNLGNKYMSNPDTLVEYMNFAKENFPADRYGLIFWDHGGGAVSGFGHDENNPNKSDTLTIDEIQIALNKFETKLEFVGFDACLMANVETAYAIKNNANYLIASEETEPGTGWDYIKTLNKLSENTAIETPELATTIVDSFIKSNNGFFGADATLSCVDLSKIENVHNNLVIFMKDVKDQELDVNKFAYVSKAIQTTKAYADGEIDTIDLVHFANNINLKSSTNLIKAINDAVIYNKTTDYVENSNGLSIYIPNKSLEYYEPMLKIYNNIGISKDYTNVLTEYVNLAAGGKNTTYVVNNHEYEQDTNNYQDYDWYDSSIINSNQDYYEETSLDTEELEVIDKDEYYALHLSEKDWEKIVSVQSVLWYDDGEGYIDLGSDSYYELDDNDDLKVTSDGKWVAINKQIVRYEVIEHTDKYEKGKVPALLNGEEVNIIIYWDKSHPDGEVIGAEPINIYGNTTLYGKGLKEIKQGDKIEFIVEYRDYSGKLDDEYIYGDEIVVGKKGLTVSYEWIGDGECMIFYLLTDIYNNLYYTEPVIVY